MNWLADYRAKTRTAEEAVSVIKSGDRVYYGGNAAIPQTLVRALANRRAELENVQLNHVLLLGDDPLSAPEMAGHFRHNSLFVGPADRKAVNDGRADYVPIFLYMIPRLFTERVVPVDVAMIAVSPPDEHGFMSLGVETLASKAACNASRHVIAQVNERMPRVLGDSFIHVRKVDAFVEASEPLPTLEPGPPNEVELAISENILPLIEQGMTVQMGIGGIPDAIYASMDGSLELGIHTEMLSDQAMKAIERGVVTGSRKTLHPGKVIITFALGSDELYDFLDNNPLIEAHPVDYVNDPFVVSQNGTYVVPGMTVDFQVSAPCSGAIRRTYNISIAIVNGEFYYGNVYGWVSGSSSSPEAFSGAALWKTSDPVAFPCPDVSITWSASWVGPAPAGVAPEEDPTQPFTDEWIRRSQDIQNQEER